MDHVLCDVCQELTNFKDLRYIPETHSTECVYCEVDKRLKPAPSLVVFNG